MSKTLSESMREWLNKLKEAPLADYQLVGDFSKPSRLKDADRKLVQHPVHIKKLENFFSKCETDFKIIICNEAKTNFDGGAFGELKFNQKDWAVETVGLTPDQFDNIFDYADGAITCIFTVNDSDHPLTPWITAHRIGHMFDDANSEFITEHVTKKVSEAAKRYMKPPGTFFALSASEILKVILTSKAAREGKLGSSQEAAVELFAEYILRGKITLNPLPKEINVQNYIFTLGQSSEEFDIYLARSIERIMDEVLNQMIGKVYLY